MLPITPVQSVDRLPGWPGQMRPRTRPPRLLRHLTRIKAVLLKVPAPPHPRIQMLRVPAVHPPEQDRQRIHMPRHHHPIHVIRHHASSKHLHLRLTQLIHYQMQIGLSINIGEEHIAAIQPALSHRMRHAGHNAPRISSQTVNGPRIQQDIGSDKIRSRRFSTEFSIQTAIKGLCSAFPPQNTSRSLLPSQSRKAPQRTKESR